MNYTFTTSDAMFAFLQARGLAHKRGALLKQWKKWKRGELPNLVATICDHDGGKALKEWDCGCSWGCDACNINVTCSVCGCGFVDMATATKMAASWLSAIA